MPVIENEFLRVEIAEDGAEIQSIRTRDDDAEWLWHGDPAWWNRRAPLLFPVVGQSPDGHVTIAGQSYPMGPHGFARDSRFGVVSTGPDRIELQLLPDDTTRASFPFAFRLGITYTLARNEITCLAQVENHDEKPMPFQFGFHPAFRWPLSGAGDAQHRVVFLDGAPRQMVHPGPDGLLIDQPHDLPVSGDVLDLHHELFANSALVFAEGAGRAFRFEGGQSRVEMRTSGLPNFALWQKPGAPYLCLEPWQGMAPFPAQGPALERRNYSLNLLPGESRQFEMQMSFRKG